MNKEQLHILQHSLGCDEYGLADIGRDENDGCFGYYRNRYVSDPTPDLLALVEAGLMRDHGAHKLAGGMHYYRVTEQGLFAMRRESPTAPKVSRARKRYLAFLDADLGCTFGEYLKNKWYAPIQDRAGRFSR